MVGILRPPADLTFEKRSSFSERLSSSVTITAKRRRQRTGCAVTDLQRDSLKGEASPKQFFSSIEPSASDKRQWRLTESLSKPSP